MRSVLDVILSMQEYVYIWIFSTDEKATLCESQLCDKSDYSPSEEQDIQREKLHDSLFFKFGIICVFPSSSKKIWHIKMLTRVATDDCILIIID